MQAPRIEKITLNMGVGEAKTESKLLDSAIEELTTIAGQRAQIRRARKSIAQFKMREGMAVGARVTLRGARMYEFLDRLVSIALPRIRDFRGLNPRSFDGRGNFSLGVREQLIFPEINYDDIQQVRGLDVTITTTAETDEHALALLRALGLPFAAEGERKESVMAKTSLVVKQRRPQKYKVRNYTRCNRCGRPRAVFKQVRPLPDLPARARAPGRDSRHDEVELVGEKTVLTDPIADMLTRIRNANKALHEHATDADLEDEGRDRPPPQGGGLHPRLPRREGRSPSIPWSSISSSAATASGSSPA